ncbi:hypothetical protein E2562_004848 [Oryza meyeriana var. granulata]|uniref:Uncharacterized protein n=1 Tax=Oryza meyeriana var. granulata TaxID=110450 RepID=A0A6G1DFE6_9ORYZ|nr:hypothetical protein E2562_004848 [Oryza meyeriana var. granulata]
MAQYPQPSAMAPPPPGPYQHGMPPVQNQAYPFAPRMHQMPMLPQQRGYAQMPMPGPPLGNGSGGKAKTTNVTVEGRSPFQLIQGYSSDDIEDEDGAGAASNLMPLTENNEHGHSIDTNPDVGHQLFTEAAPCTERSLEGREHQLMNKSNPVKHDSDELGHPVKEDLIDNDSDRGQQTRRHGRSQWNRSRGQSPQGRRSCSPLPQSSSPGRQISSPLAKRANLLQNKSPDGVGHTFRAQPGVKLGISKDGFCNDKHDSRAKVATPFEIHPAGGVSFSESMSSWPGAVWFETSSYTILKYDPTPRATVTFKFRISPDALPA